MMASPVDESRLDDLRRLYDHAFSVVAQALSLDESGVRQQAAVIYHHGLTAFEDAMTAAAALTAAVVGVDLAKMAATMLQEMSAAKTHIQRRLVELMSDDANTTEADELLSIHNGAQLYYISPAGEASAARDVPHLAIYRLRSAAAADDRQGALPADATFLQVGGWTYPLVATPVLRTTWGAYIFPDPMAAVPGSSVGIVIRDTVTTDQRDTFERILRRHSELKIQTQSEEDPPTAKKIANGIDRVSTWIASSMTSGATATGGYIQKGSAMVRQRITPNEAVVHVPPYALTGVYYSKQATGLAVNISNDIISRLGQAMMSLGRKVAPMVKETGSSVFPSAFKPSDSPSGRSTFDNVTEVASGGLKGVVTVVGGLEQAARILAASLANETVSIVEHKYGSSVGLVTQNALSTVVNIAQTIYNLAAFRPRSLLRRTAKGTGYGLVSELATPAPTPTPPAANDDGKREGGTNGLPHPAGDGLGERPGNRSDVGGASGGPSSPQRPPAFNPSA